MTTETSEVPRLAGCVVLIPVKAFAAGKARLAPTLDADGRAELSRMMAGRVLEAAAPLPVAVVCDDAEVASWAVGNGAMALPEPGRGLNGAVEAGVARLAALGADEVLVAHADLPMAHGLAQLAGFDGVTLVPDRRDDGTNVVCVPAHARFRFSYGPGSFLRHRAEAELLGLPYRVVRQPDLAWDVDVPSDIPAEFVPTARL
ncbi:MAG TPA: 2-phospho-L-lactate guanylyltransferase [Acidimicrobiales bacterium]|nr:2-phospho-L-lactate guanylyltransferase [Acidimicrobiales bacterium]